MLIVKAGSVVHVQWQTNNPFNKSGLQACVCLRGPLLWERALQSARRRNLWAASVWQASGNYYYAKPLIMHRDRVTRSRFCITYQPSLSLALGFTLALFGSGFSLWRWAFYTCKTAAWSCWRLSLSERLSRVGLQIRIFFVCRSRVGLNCRD